MTTSNLIESEGPLETLIFKQLGELLHGEKTLAEKYATLQFADERENSRFQTEVLALNKRADRLQRMIEAMGLSNWVEFDFDQDPLVA
jgi:hypothetical protein